MYNKAQVSSDIADSAISIKTSEKNVIL